jgi:hypothetical protein
MQGAAKTLVLTLGAGMDAEIGVADQTLNLRRRIGLLPAGQEV